MFRASFATNSDLLVINSISASFGHLYARHQEIRLRSTTYSCLSCCSCCDAGESGGKMCTLCGECCLTLSGNILHTEHGDARNITVLIIRRSNCINTSSGMISLCKWLLGMPVRPPEWRIKQSLTQTNHTRWCINTIRSPDDEHGDSRNM